MEKDHQVRITFTGDAMCSQKQIENKDFNPLRGIKKAFRISDFVVANLETPIAGENLGYTFEQYIFNTPIDFAQSLKDIGIDMVTTANNHCLDRGIEGIVGTVEALDGIGLKHTGTFIDKDSPRILYEEINGIKVAFISYTYGTNAWFNNVYLKRNERHKVNLLQNQELSSLFDKQLLKANSIFGRLYRKIISYRDPEQLRREPYERREIRGYWKRMFRNDIRDAKNMGAEYVIACMHIGGQYNRSPSDYTQELVKFAWRTGADAVIGNHEHVIHGYEECGDKFACYSLGNLSAVAGVSEPPFNRLAECSVLLHLNLKKTDSGKIITDPSFSIAKTVIDAKGHIETRLLYDLIHDAADNDSRDALLLENALSVYAFSADKELAKTLQPEYPLYSKALS